MTLIEESLPGIQETLDKCEWKDIYNMDEAGLFYRLQVYFDGSLATKQLEGRKQNKECITLTVCCNGIESDKLPLLVIGKSKSSLCIKTPTLTPSAAIPKQQLSMDDTSHLHRVDETI
uniref:DDE-1 domain-containing protein n=1 Tax=Peronospora matthiolae TaxID=2874970 RepID=A0AAV1TVI1_9STRA